MNKKLLIIAAVLVVALVVAAALYPRLAEGEQAQQPAVSPTETTETTAATETNEATEAAESATVAAPNFTVQDWDGNEVQLHDYVGKPIVLNFWAHWCGPCQMEMPEFNATYEELGGEVTFLMVHVGAGVDDGKAKVTEGGYTFPVVFDAESTAAQTYGINAYPTSFFIDAEGNLQAYYVGMMDHDLLQSGIDMIYTAEE